MSSFLGTTQLYNEGIVFVRDSFTNDPGALPTRSTEWQGTKTACDQLAASLPCRTDVTQITGPLFRVVATRVGGAAREGGNHSDLVWVDQWTIATDALEKEIWAHPIVFAASYLYDPLNTNSFKKELEDYAANSGDGAASPPECVSDTTSFTYTVTDTQYTVGGVAQQVITELGRGATHYEDEYVTLRRRRQISSGFPQSMPLYTTRLVYQTGQIPMPGDILFSLPSTESMYVPPQSKWGWRLRNQNSDFLQPGKIEQTFEWVLAAWSTLLYTPSNENFPD